MSIRAEQIWSIASIPTTATVVPIGIRVVLRVSQVIKIDDCATCWAGPVVVIRYRKPAEWHSLLPIIKHHFARWYFMNWCCYLHSTLWAKEDDAVHSARCPLT
jgi:hypothetical protein